MTLGKLIKELQKLEEQLGSHAPVGLDARRYKNWHECWQYDKLSDIETQSVTLVDADGFQRPYAQERTWVILNGL